jgi:predicted small secreted protein
MKSSTLLIALLVLQAISFISCNKDEGPGEPPDVIINVTPFSISEDAPGLYITVPVYLSATYGDVVTVDYSTQDSTAVAGRNYEAASGTLTFNPGETLKPIMVNIMHDTAGKQDLYFKIKLSNPVNTLLTLSNIRVKIVNIDYATLVWSDEFGTSPLNSNWWNYEEGNNNGWGNNELEVYTRDPENVHIDSGYLHITALNPWEGHYTSGRITTQNKKVFTYGKMEIRARLPEGQGIWPALWMLGNNFAEVSWPRCGEIDIMEYLGHETNKVYGTLHWDDIGHKYLGSNTTLPTGSFHADFHLFTLIWTQNSIKWMVDSQQYFELTRDVVGKFPFDLPQFFIFNVAVGGNWPGPPDETTVFPQHMIVDYIRVYQ